MERLVGNSRGRVFLLCPGQRRDIRISRFGEWYIQDETRSLAFRAFHVDRALMGISDPLD